MVTFHLPYVLFNMATQMRDGIQDKVSYQLFGKVSKIKIAHGDQD